MTAGQSYTEVLNRIKVNMCRSLVAEPCSYNRILKRPFLQHVGWIGVKNAFQELVRDGVINEDARGMLTVNEKYIAEYSKPVENVF
jgi:hypothetical protein